MSKAFFMMILLQINIIVYYNNAYNRLLKIQLLKQSYNMSASYRYVFLTRTELKSDFLCKISFKIYTVFNLKNSRAIVLRTIYSFYDEKDYFFLSYSIINCILLFICHHL